MCSTFDIFLAQKSMVGLTSGLTLQCFCSVQPLFLYLFLSFFFFFTASQSNSSLKKQRSRSIFSTFFCCFRNYNVEPPATNSSSPPPPVEENGSPPKVGLKQSSVGPHLLSLFHRMPNSIFISVVSL